MSFDSTMKFSNKMNRAEIEAMLGECRAFAAAADLQKRIFGCLEKLGAKDEYALLIDRLDMLYMNLPNLG